MPYDMTTILKDRAARLCLLCALTLVGTACDDVTSATSSGSTGDAGSTTTGTEPMTTSGPAGTDSTTTDPSSTTDPSTTIGADSSTTDTTDPTDTTDTTTDATDGSTTDEPTSGSTGDESSSSSSTGEPLEECPYGDLMSPDLVNANTAGQDSEFTNSCGGGGAPDVSYTLTAPAAGTYFFTATSPDGVVDPLVAVYDGTCGGPELACNEDIDGGTTAARVSASLTAGQTVTVVLDGFSLGGGAIDLEVAFFEGTCPDADAGNVVPVAISSSTAAGDNTTFGTCGGTTGNDDQYTFIAPEPGVFTFDTLGSSFDTVLYVLDTCGGTELACNDNSEDNTSRINLTMAADEEVVIVVDGAGLENGDYNLNVNFDECPDADLGNALPITVAGNTEFETDASSGSCGPGDSNDIAYTFTAPEAGTYVFDTNGSDFDTVLYYYDGAVCVGTELACDDDGGDGLDSQLLIPLVADEQITLVVDGRFGNFGNYVLNVTLPECGNGNIELGETCDTDDLAGATCISQGLGAGEISCSDTCSLDVSLCTTCGNGTVEGDDECDGVALGQQTCIDQGFAGGSLDCDGTCAYDTAQCSDDIVVVCSSPGLAIDSANPTTTDTITITDLGPIADVDVFVDITHTWSADLDMSLSADDLALSNNLSFDLCDGDDDVFATFNDEGSAAVGVDCDEPIAIEGNLTPQQPMSVYDGLEASGEWTLSITDDTGGDAGTLNEWCVFITLE